MLAANRKDNVKGRTKILIISTITKKGFNQSGAPPGNNLAKKDVGAHVNPEKIKANQNGKPNLRVSTK